MISRSEKVVWLCFFQLVLMSQGSLLAEITVTPALASFVMPLDKSAPAPDVLVLSTSSAGDVYDIDKANVRWVTPPGTPFSFSLSGARITKSQNENITIAVTPFGNRTALEVSGPKRTKSSCARHRRQVSSARSLHRRQLRLVELGCYWPGCSSYAVFSGCESRDRSRSLPAIGVGDSRLTHRRSGQAANRWLGGLRRLALLESTRQHRSEDFVPPAAQRYAVRRSGTTACAFAEEPAIMKSHGEVICTRRRFA